MMYILYLPIACGIVLYTSLKSKNKETSKELKEVKSTVAPIIKKQKAISKSLEQKKIVFEEKKRSIAYQDTMLFSSLINIMLTNKSNFIDIIKSINKTSSLYTNNELNAILKDLLLNGTDDYYQNIVRLVSDKYQVKDEMASLLATEIICSISDHLNESQKYIKFEEIDLFESWLKNNHKKISQVLEREYLEITDLNSLVKKYFNLCVNLRLFAHLASP